MTTHALINTNTCIVENIIIVDDAPEFTPPAGYIIVASETAAIGDTWDGETIIHNAPPPPPTPPITVVSPRQIRLALNQLGLREQVESFVSAASQDVRDSWEYSTQFERDNVFILACAQVLNKTPEDTDALFSLAASL